MHTTVIEILINVAFLLFICLLAQIVLKAYENSIRTVKEYKLKEKAKKNKDRTTVEVKTTLEKLKVAEDDNKNNTEKD